MNSLLERAAAGDVRAVGRLITLVEAESSDTKDIMKSVYPMTGRAHVIGITGSPGAGKSSFVNRLIARFRSEGKKVGVLKLRVYRPFPAEEIAAALKNVKAIAAMDRAESFSGNSGPMSCELRAALFSAKQTPDVLSMVYGLGGRDITVEDMEKIFGDLMAGNFECKELPYRYVNVRE